MERATSGNGELLALVGLILVDGGPTNHIDLMAGSAKNFMAIMKDGKVDKNSVR